MTPDGTAATRFKRALETRSLMLAEMSMRETAARTSATGTKRVHTCTQRSHFDPSRPTLRTGGIPGLFGRCNDHGRPCKRVHRGIAGNPAAVRCDDVAGRAADI